MSYVVGNAGVIKDPFVVEELDRIQAALKGLEGLIQQVTEEKPDLPVPTTKGDPTNPDRTTPPATLGVRFLTGPWLIGADEVGNMPKIASYSVFLTGEWATDQHNFAIPDSTIMLEISASSAINLTGIRITKKHRRLVGILNRGSSTLSIVNQSTSSEAAYRFSWGDTGDAGETIDVPTGCVVWVYYDPYSRRWRLFAIPAVGGDNIPPSIVPEQPAVPPVHHWFSAQVTMNNTTTGLVGIYENAPSVAGASAAIVVDTTGVGRESTSGAVAGNLAGVAANGTPPLVRGILDYTWITIMRTGASLADLRIWVVLSTNAPTNSDDYGGNIVGFRYSSVVPDGGWVGVCRDGATQSVTGTVASIAVSTVYKLKVRKVGSTIYFSVNDSVEVAHTSNLPADTTSLVWYCYVTTNAAAAKTLTWYRHSLRAQVEP